MPADRLLVQAVAVAALSADRDLLLEAIEATDLEQPPVIAVAHNPLGGGEMTVLDVVSHVCMWDEINAALLAEAIRGRRHWSLQAEWQTRPAGAALDAGGVEAGRLLPPELVIDRFVNARAALIDSIAEVSTLVWSAVVDFEYAGRQPTLGELCKLVNTPESDRTGERAYRHATAHLSATSQEPRPATG